MKRHVMKRHVMKRRRNAGGDEELRELERAFKADPHDARVANALWQAKARRGDERALLGLEAWERQGRPVLPDGRMGVFYTAQIDAPFLGHLDSAPYEILWVKAGRRDPRVDPRPGDRLIRSRPGERSTEPQRHLFHVLRRDDTPEWGNLARVWYRETMTDNEGDHLYPDTWRSLQAWRELHGGTPDMGLLTIAGSEPTVRKRNPGHKHPRVKTPVSRTTIENELAAAYKQAGFPGDPVVSFPDDLTRLHETEPRRYAQVFLGNGDPKLGGHAKPRFEFAEQTRWLPRAHRKALVAHEVGHVLTPGGTEDDADRAAREVLGVRIGYDHRWVGKGLQVARRNPGGDEELRSLERDALAGDPVARLRHAAELERRGRGLTAIATELLARANGDRPFGHLELVEVAQAAMAVLASPTERGPLPSPWKDDNSRRLPGRATPPWPGTAWVSLSGEFESGDILDASTRVLHSLRTHVMVVRRDIPPATIVADRPDDRILTLLDGLVTLAIAPTARFSIGGRERNFEHYRPSADPVDAWPDLLPSGYVGFHVSHPLHQLRSADHGVAGYEAPTDGFFGYVDMRLGSAYDWSRRPGHDRVITTLEALRLFVERVQPPAPAWW